MIYKRISRKYREALTILSHGGTIDNFLLNKLIDKGYLSKIGEISEEVLSILKRKFRINWSSEYERILYSPTEIKSPNDQYKLDRLIELGYLTPDLKRTGKESRSIKNITYQFFNISSEEAYRDFISEHKRYIDRIVKNYMFLKKLRRLYGKSKE